MGSLQNERNAICATYKNRVLIMLLEDEVRTYKEITTINVVI